MTHPVLRACLREWVVCHMFDQRPVSGRCWKRNRPRRSIARMWWCTATGGLRLGGMGMSSVRFRLNASQQADNGQMSQVGLALVQISAPSSITDWLKSPGRLGGTSCSASCQRLFASGGFVDGLLDQEEACQDTCDVAVEDRGGAVVSDRGDGSGGISADTRKLE